MPLSVTVTVTVQRTGLWLSGVCHYLLDFTMFVLYDVCSYTYVRVSMPLVGRLRYQL